MSSLKDKIMALSDCRKYNEMVESLTDEERKEFNTTAWYDPEIKAHFDKILPKMNMNLDEED